MKCAAAILTACLLSPGTVLAAPQHAPVTVDTKAASLAWGPCPAIFPEGCELLVLHGDPSQPNADVLLRVQPGVRLPTHSHTSVERILLIEGRMSAKYDGAPEATLEAGTYAWGPGGVAHQVACVSDTPCVVFIAFEGPVDAAPFTGTLR